jgi:hypothetical protein
MYHALRYDTLASGRVLTQQPVTWVRSRKGLGLVGLSARMRRRLIGVEFGVMVSLSLHVQWLHCRDGKEIVEKAYIFRLGRVAEWQTLRT